MFYVKIVCVMVIIVVVKLAGCDNTTCEEIDSFQEKKREDAFRLTTPEERPYAVLVRGRTSNRRATTCSGSLLSAEVVLTAAHCVHGKHEVLVYAGGTCRREIQGDMPATGQVREVLQTYVCPGYVSESQGRDIAVLKVDGAFTLTTSVNTIPLNPHPWPAKSSRPCEVTGFGAVHWRETHPQDYRRKTQPLRGHKPCACHCKLEVVFGEEAVRGWLCSKPREDYGLCLGDSGGALVCGGRVSGVASLIVGGTDLASCRFSAGRSSVQCGSKDTLSVFTDVCRHVPWLQTVVPSLNMTVNNSDCIKYSSAHKAFFHNTQLALMFAITFLNTV